MRQKLLSLILTTLLFTLACHPAVTRNAPTPTAQSTRPNIILILADDLGYGDLGSYGQHQIQTPNIDALAKNGMRFTQAYAGAPVCAPSRCSLMTGLTTGHTLIRGNAKINLRPSDTTLPEVLQHAGYATAAVGKWGLGAANSPGTPTKKGFDYFYGYIDQTHAHNAYPTYLYRNDTKVPLRNVVPNEGRYGTGEATVKVDYSEDLFDNEIVNYLHNAATDKPFFLYAAFTAPHANDEARTCEVPDLGIYADKPWPIKEKRYAALVSRLDRDVGHIVAEVKARHEENNTLIFFASDNGAHEEGGHSADFFNSSGPLRGVKRDMYEGGIRVPLLASWPRHIAPNSTTDTQAAFWDFLPTLAALAATPAPATDGLSFVPTLLQNAPQPAHPYLYWEFHERGFEQAVRLDDWKAVRHGPHGKMELYYLHTDLAEAHDIADAHHDIVEKAAEIMRTARTDSPDFPIRDRTAF